MILICSKGSKLFLMTKIILITFTTLWIKFVEHYYRLNVCIFPRFIHWNVNSQEYTGIWRWDLWEIIRVRWGHEGGAPVVGFVPFKERPESLLSLSHEDTERRQPPAGQEESSHQELNAGTLILDFKLSEPWEKNRTFRKTQIRGRQFCSYKGIQALKGKKVSLSNAFLR